MVNNKNISLYGGEPPATDVDRKISGGPLYPPEQVWEILSTGGEKLRLLTRRCIQESQQLGMDTDDLAQLLCKAVRNGTYRGSEWCLQKEDGPWLACDVYTLVQSKWNEFAHKELECEYFLKFAINRTGALVLMVSSHLSR